MKISVAIIAHNEEKYIEHCITSVLTQTRPADEIVLVAHNCTDGTVAIAQKYPIRIIELNEGIGTTISRAKAIESCTGDIVCCTDGDCWVDNHWVETISRPLLQNSAVSIIGGYTKIKNNLFWKLSCWWQFVVNRKIKNKKSHRFAWGSNFAFRKRDYETVGGLTPFLDIRKKLQLNYDAEDLYLSLALQTIGKIVFATTAYVYTLMPPEKASVAAQKIIVPKQQEDNQKLFAFFKV